MSEEWRTDRKPDLTLDLLRDVFELVPEGSGIRWRKDMGANKVLGRCAGSVVINRRNKKYWHVQVLGRKCKAHRIVFALANNQIPPPEIHIDHIDGNGLNNSPSNLRLATCLENNRNLQGARKDSGSGILGVYWHKVNKKWGATIRANGKSIYLGQYSTIEEAKAARKAGELKHWGSVNHV